MKKKNVLSLKSTNKLSIFSIFKATVQDNPAVLLWLKVESNITRTRTTSDIIITYSQIHKDG